MGSFDAPDFGAFLRDVHGHLPFPWQSRLADRVLTSGNWPSLLDLPTGAGKTAALDLALFAFASQPAMAPRRIVFVVDRRVIVSQVATRAKALLRALTDPDRRGVVQEVSARLRAVFAPDDPDAAPFTFAELRGGIALDESWTDRPDVPTVAVSTVDQVGSRLLFRGYGVGASMRPVHAGLLGNDTLFLLDEVHLSRPFAQTLRELREHHRPASALPDRWQVVEMTATPGRDLPEDVLGLSAEDRDPASELGRRLNAIKRARLEIVGAASQRPEEALAVSLPLLARSLPGRTVGIVVNRVETARRIADELAAGGESEVVLVTGRMRPLDRDDLWARVEPRIRTGRTRTPDADRLYVVATQAVEAGADLDFDAMATEVAPVDSLRQRFGRVDRLGELSTAGTPAEIVIVAARAQTKSSYVDQVYGPALTATWDELAARHGDSTFDVGPMSPDLAEGDRFLAPARRAPLLLRSHLDAWVQTHPRPVGDPDVALWLHGTSETTPDVNVVWRADLSDTLLDHVADAEARGDVGAREGLVELLVACPPKTVEAVAVPIWSARSWLQEEADADPVADVDQPSPAPSGRIPPASHRAVRWRGIESKVVEARELRPGDTIVVPASRGGIARHNWDPTASNGVDDLGDRAQFEARVAPVIRLNADVVGPHVGRPEDVPTAPVPGDTDWFDAEVPREEVEAWLDAVRAAEPRPWLDALLRVPIHRWVLRTVAAERPPHGTATYLLRGRAPRTSGAALAGLQPPHASAELDGTDWTNSFTGIRVILQDHLAGVASLAQRFAQACGVPDAVAHDVALAAGLHDLGKADPRFQLWLHDGDEIAASRADALLAKSTADHRDPRRRLHARERAGYPPGMRHELLSVALIESAPEVLVDAHDADLVLHLVATHHGHCRALAPPQPDSNPVTASVDHAGTILRATSDHHLDRLDSGVTDRFWRLHRRYGAHGLAWLEAITRLADHRRSALEQEADR